MIRINYRMINLNRCITYVQKHVSCNSEYAFVFIKSHTRIEWAHYEKFDFGAIRWILMLPYYLTYISSIKIMILISFFILASEWSFTCTSLCICTHQCCDLPLRLHQNQITSLLPILLLLTPDLSE